MRGMLGRRGDETSGGGALLLALLALVVLMLVGLGTYRLATGHWIPAFIPGFNASNEVKSELAMVRYVISDDRVDYYDGATWRAFGDVERDVGGTVYVGAKLREAIKGAYFDTRLERRSAEEVVLFDGYFARIRAMQAYASAGYERGDVIVELRRRTEDGGNLQLQAEYTVRGAAGDAVLVGTGEDFLAKNIVAREEVRRRAVAWRERALETPVRISLSREGAEGVAYVCFRRTAGAEDLVADLSRDVGEQGTCREPPAGSSQLQQPAPRRSTA